MATPPDQTPSAPPTPEQQLGGRNPRTLRIVVAVVAVVIIIAGVAAYVVLSQPATPGNQCSLSSTNPLIYDQPEAPDNVDPASTFSTPGWGAVQQVYQNLVMYNGSSYTDFVGVVAKDWTFSVSGMNITFHIRPGIHFSDKNPVNAYTMWFSLYRSIVMNQPPEFILGENFYLPHLNYSSDPGQIANMTQNMTTYLSSWNFTAPTPTALSFMKDPFQSFQVIDNLTLQVNLGYGYLGTTVAYHYILATLASPVGAAVDPAVVQAHGGVTNASNAWMNLNLEGSGPYTASYDPNTGITLTPDPSYWGSAAAAAEPSNNILQPAKSSIQIYFKGTQTNEVTDLKNGNVASASFAYVGPSTINDLKTAACLTVKALPSVYSSTSGGWWIYMNQNYAPFNNLSVREAVVHAINYQEIISVAFGGYATQWVGPVPPGYPYDNNATAKEPYYQYNLALAQQEMNNSPYPLPGGYSTTLNYLYINQGDSWPTVATLLKSDLAKIGITLNPVGLTLDQLYQEQVTDASGNCVSTTSVNGGPFYIGQEFYTSDYIAPDDWTQNNAISWGSANVCMAEYANATMDNLVISAAGDSNTANLTADYTQMTQLMYYNYTVAWLVVPTQFQVYNSLLKGIVSNPMGSGLPFVMTFNTEYV